MPATDPNRRQVLRWSALAAGSIPLGALLAGLSVRNGSNPQHSDSSHWFFGDGMVHGVQLERGKAKWYRNRYVHTPLYDAGLGFGAHAFDGAFTSVARGPVARIALPQRVPYGFHGTWVTV